MTIHMIFKHVRLHIHACEFMWCREDLNLTYYDKDPIYYIQIMVTCFKFLHSNPGKKKLGSPALMSLPPKCFRHSFTSSPLLKHESSEELATSEFLRGMLGNSKGLLRSGSLTNRKKNMLSTLPGTQAGLSGT